MTAEEYAARFATAIVIAAVEVGRPEAMDVFSEYLNNGENKEKALQLFTSSLITEFSTAPDPRPETSDFLTAMVARSASVRATDFENNKHVASEFLKNHKDFILTFEEEPIPNPLPEVEPPPVNPGPGPKSKETDKNPKKESIWDKLAEAMTGIELVIATVIASGELNREWEKRNTADGRSETNTEKFLRHAATKGLIAAVPIVAFFSYRAIKASTKDNETLDDARRAVMRTIAGGAAIFGLGHAFEHFRNSNNTASPDEVGDAARKGIADYIKEAKKAAQQLGLGDLELPEGDGSTLDNVLRAIRAKSETIQIGADEFDSLMTLIKMAIKAGDGLSDYGYKFAEKFDIDVSNVPQEDLKAVLGFVNETVGRLGTTAETAETVARLIKAMVTGIIQARNPELPITNKVLQGFYQIFNAVSEPAPKRPETQEDMLKAAKKAVSKLSGVLTQDQMEVILEALEPEPQPEPEATV